MIHTTILADGGKAIGFYFLKCFCEEEELLKELVRKSSTILAQNTSNIKNIFFFRNLKLVNCDLMNYLSKFLSLDVSRDKIFTLLVLYILLRQRISQSYPCNFKNSGKTVTPEELS